MLPVEQGQGAGDHLIKAQAVESRLVGSGYAEFVLVWFGVAVMLS